MRTPNKFAAALLAFLAGAVPAAGQGITTQTFPGYVGTLPTTTSCGTADKLYILQGGVSKAIQLCNNITFTGGLSVGQNGVQAGQITLFGGASGSGVLTENNLGTTLTLTGSTLSLGSAGGLAGQLNFIGNTSGSSSLVSTATGTQVVLFTNVAAQNSAFGVGIAGSTTGQVFFNNGGVGGGTVGLQASNVLAANNYTLLLPATLGSSGQALLSAGVGSAMTWSTPNLAGYNIVQRFGSLDLCQRGAGASCAIGVGAASTAYTVDGCYLTANANQASTVFSIAGIATGSLRAAQVFRNNGQTGISTMSFGCPLDSDEIALMRGQFVTLSFTMATGANFSSSSTVIDLICGTGAPVKQITGYTGQTLPIQIVGPATANSPATRYQATTAAVIPANCTQAEVTVFWNPSGTAGAIDAFTIDDIQVEVVPAATSVASNFQKTTFETQLHLAQRHYVKTFPYGTAPAQNAGVAGALTAVDTVNTVATLMNWSFPRQMRVSPTITTYNPSAANANCRNISGAADLAVTSNASGGLSADHVDFSCAAGGAAGNVIGIQAQADAGI